MFELALTAARSASTLEEELERLKLDVWLVATAVFTTPRAESTLEDDDESEREEVLAAASAASILDDEDERLRLEVWFVETLALVVLRAASTLDDD